MAEQQPWLLANYLPVKHLCKFFFFVANCIQRQMNCSIILQLSPINLHSQLPPRATKVCYTVQTYLLQPIRKTRQPPTLVLCYTATHHLYIQLVSVSSHYNQFYRLNNSGQWFSPSKANMSCTYSLQCADWVATTIRCYIGCMYVTEGLKDVSLAVMPYSSVVGSIIDVHVVSIQPPCLAQRLLSIQQSDTQP